MLRLHEQFLKTEEANKVVYERLVRIKRNSVLPEVKKNGLMTASSRATLQVGLPTSFQFYQNN